MQSYRRICLSLLVALAAFCAPLAHAADPLAPDISFSVTSVSSLTGQKLQVVDLAGVASTKNRGDIVGLEVEVLTNSTAPGAARTLTVYYGFAAVGTYTATEMGTNASSSAISLVNSADTKRVYGLPVVYLGARYLYLWVDHSARDAGSTLTITVRINGLSR